MDEVIQLAAAHERYHDRMAILGGIDVDFLPRQPQEGLRPI